ncbi:MAG: nickel transporter permease [Sarcina sp.]
MKKLGWIGLGILTSIFILALLAPILTSFDPNEINLANRFLEPSKVNLLGTDNLGRDVFTRVLYGARISIFISIIVLVISLVIGVSIGLICGYLGGFVDEFFMGIVDIILAFPDMILILAIAGMLGASILNSIICMCIVSWVGYARTIRAIVISIKNKDFIKAAKVCGSSDVYILFRHILPNILKPIVVLAASSIGFIVLRISALSFLGLGIQPPTAEWGAMLNEGKGYLQNAPWMMIGPGLFLTLFVAGCNLVGDSFVEE